MSRFISADLIIPADQPPLINGIAEITEEGKIISISQGEIPPNTEIYKGVIVPGFINAHCHLELSHLRGLIPQKEGMPSFIRNLIAKRFSVSDDVQLKAMQYAEQEMFDAGIVAVGDISNFSLSSVIKNNKKLYYHTFIEILGLESENAVKIFADGELLYSLFSENGNASIVPHAAYSVSDELFHLIKANKNYTHPSSVHMEESREEFEFCSDKKGAFAELFNELKINYSSFSATPGKTPLQRTLPKMNTATLQLVHNTYTTAAEIQWAESLHPELFWCLCPNANLFINDFLPDFSLFKNDLLKVTIGTDSLASNLQLSILEEIKTISNADKTIPLEQLIKWGTFNGAWFLGIEKKYGSISPGKTPGLVLIENINAEQLTIEKNSHCKRIV